MEQAIFQKQKEIFVTDCRLKRPEFVNYYEFPCLSDDTATTGFDPHYVYHVAWAVKKIYESKPREHVDVSSSLHFCSAIAPFTKTTFIDFRPATLQLDNLNCIAGDLNEADQWKHREFESLSCMHVVEHIGLGRYGDPLSVDSDIVAMDNLINATKSGGRLLFVVPVGKAEIYFNAHRVYSATWLVNFFSKACRLNEFYLIPSSSQMRPMLNCDLTTADQFTYACGCFEFIKF
jgi:hypothetical protein